jgi:hypothetical protein
MSNMAELLVPVPDLNIGILLIFLKILKGDVWLNSSRTDSRLKETLNFKLSVACF